MSTTLAERNQRCMVSSRTHGSRSSSGRENRCHKVSGSDCFSSNAAYGYFAMGLAEVGIAEGPFGRCEQSIAQRWLPRVPGLSPLLRQVATFYNWRSRYGSTEISQAT